ncbi:MAG: glycosyltransferase family 2 protein [Candidatus Levybacteria bacterium]|nr:glycosyltransferase family 2 protein [Candidatus Levybacteria bacterium]
MNKNPLVSICTTFFNAERYIHRLLESCLNQTHRNVEIVILDDASTDGSERVIREYIARDSRVKYFKNDARVGLSESLSKLFKLARGDFSMMIGADDWLKEDYIENGVRNFSEHPDAAGVVPKVVSLSEVSDGKFEYGSETDFPSRVYSAKWFMKRMYRPVLLYISGYALVRNKDLVSAGDYHTQNYYHNPSKSIPEELREFFRRGYGTDSMLFPEILTRYKYFIFDDSMSYIKISHWENQYFESNRDSVYEIFKDSYYFMLIYKFIYKSKWPGFYRGMKIFRGAEALSTVFIHFFRCRLHPSFSNVSKSRKLISDFFSDFSVFEIIMAVTYSIPMAIYRGLIFAGKKLFRREKDKTKGHSIFTQENFLSPEGRFKVN